MVLYVIKAQDFVKVGVSIDYKNRRMSYKNIEKERVFDNLDEDLAILLESLTVKNFDGSTEFLYGVDFDLVVSFISSMLDIKIDNYFFSPLDLYLKVNSEGYYDMSPCIDYVNNVRNNKGKNPILIADYLRTQKTLDFISLVKSKVGYEPVIAKAGRYGGTYARPEIIIDFLVEADTSVKYDILNWVWKNKLEYTNFMNFVVPSNTTRSLIGATK